MGHFFEVWSRPGDPNFGRVLDDPASRVGTLHDGVNLLGDGSMAMPSSLPQSVFDSILKVDPVTPANSVSSLVRVFSETDPTTPVFEWIPRAIVPPQNKEDPDVNVSGWSIKSVLDYARTEPYDWDGSDDFAPLAPDWNFGGTDILQNGSFEDSPMPNGGFEDGNTGYWQTTTPGDFLASPSGLLAVKDAAVAQAGDWYGLIDAPVQQSGAQRTFNGLIPGETYTITGFLQDPTASGDRYRMGVAGAVTATHTNAYFANDYWWAELGNATMGNGFSDGTWQQTTLTFEAAAETATLVIIYQTAGTGPDTRIDSWSITGDGVGLYPWRPIVPFPTTLFFEHRTDVVNCGTGSARWQAVDFPRSTSFGVSSWGNVGIEQPVTVTAGAPHYASVFVRHSAGVNRTYRLVIERQTPVGAIGSPGSSWIDSVTVSVPTDTWTELALPFTPDVNEILFQVRYVGSAGTPTSPLTYTDCGILFEGLAPTTWGDIVGQLYAQMTDPDLQGTIYWDDGSGTDTPYITLDFDESVDSAGVAWDRPEITTRVYQRQTLLQVLEFGGQSYNYEFRVVPDDVELGTWLLQVYNPGGMMVDYQTAQTPAIQGGQGDTQRGIRRFLPATDYMVEGLGRVTGRARDAALVGALGKIGSQRITRELPDIPSVAAAAQEDADDAVASGLTYPYVITIPQDTPPGADIPLDAYVLGDALTIHDPPEVDDVGRFWDVVATFSAEQTEWEVQFLPLSVSGGSP